MAIWWYTTFQGMDVIKIFHGMAGPICKKVFHIIGSNKGLLRMDSNKVFTQMAKRYSVKWPGLMVKLYSKEMVVMIFSLKWMAMRYFHQMVKRYSVKWPSLIAIQYSNDLVTIKFSLEWIAILHFTKWQKVIWQNCQSNGNKVFLRMDGNKVFPRMTKKYSEKWPGPMAIRYSKELEKIR
jgi:hypothetical protein